MPAIASSAFSAPVRSKLGVGPASTRKMTKHTTITKLLAMGAAAVIANLRFAYRRPVAIAPNA